MCCIPYFRERLTTHQVIHLGTEVVPIMRKAVASVETVFSSLAVVAKHKYLPVDHSPISHINPVTYSSRALTEVLINMQMRVPPCKAIYSIHIFYSGLKTPANHFSILNHLQAR